MPTLAFYSIPMRDQGGGSRRMSFEVGGAFAEIVCRQLIQINAFIVSTSQIGRIVGAVAMAHLADKLHVDKQKIDRAELAVLLSLIGSGLGLCVLGAAVYDIGRAFSIW